MIEGLGLIIVAAGTSNRMNGVDKIWARLGEQSVVWHSLHKLGEVAEHTVVVVHETQRERAEAELVSCEPSPTIVVGGLRRQDSVSCGLAALPSMRIVAVHDAARPFAEPDLLLRGVELVEHCDGAVPGLPVTDTIKRVDERGDIVSTIEREILRSVQTPQVFRRDSLVKAHASPRASQGTATDDASLLEACGGKVQVFPGQWGNFKITTEYDLEIARLLMTGACPS